MKDWMNPTTFARRAAVIPSHNHPRPFKAAQSPPLRRGSRAIRLQSNTDSMREMRAMTKQNIERRREQIDQLETDLEIVRRLQALNDTDTEILLEEDDAVDTTPQVGDLDRTETALKQLEAQFVSEIQTSAEIATGFTEALSPLLHGDDPKAIKDGFAQFVAWREKQKAKRSPQP